MEVIVVGQHVPNFGDSAIEIVEQRNITFPLDSAECDAVLANLLRDARRAGANIVLQMVPAVLVGSICRAIRDGYAGPVQVYATKTVPGPRPGKVTRRFFDTDDDTLRDAVTFANPRAKVTKDETDEWYVFVEIDGPQSPFVFAGLERLL